MQGISLTHPSTSLEKKYESNDHINNLHLHLNNSKLNGSRNSENKSNYLTKTLLKSKKSSIPLKRSNSSSQLSYQLTNHNSAKEKRISSAKINRNKTSNNYVFQTPFESNDKPLMITSKFFFIIMKIIKYITREYIIIITKY